MENMNEKSEKKHSYRQKSPNDFAKTVVIFVCVELIIVVGAIIGVNKIACNAVHKLEAAMPIRLSPLMTKHISNRLNMSSRAIKLRLKRLIKQ